VELIFFKCMESEVLREVLMKMKPQLIQLLSISFAGVLQDTVDVRCKNRNAVCHFPVAHAPDRRMQTNVGHLDHVF
jgi:hypothetical protein